MRSTATAFLALALAGLGACGANAVRSDGGMTQGAPDAGGGADSGSVTPQAAPLGATPHAGGTTFRVWAPHADAVFVSGDFNGWSASANPMTADASGVFTADVAGAATGQAYEFLVQHGPDTFHRADPRARALDNWQGHSLIVDSTAYTWSNGDFTPPPVEQQVIY